MMGDRRLINPSLYNPATSERRSTAVLSVCPPHAKLREAPSGRELSPKATEGERGTMRLTLPQSDAVSFHRYRGPPPSRREAIRGSVAVLPRGIPVSVTIKSEAERPAQLAEKLKKAEPQGEAPVSFAVSGKNSGFVLGQPRL